MTGELGMAEKSGMICGRFAPSPSGRMHLGNIFAALLAWLDVRSNNGRMVLRIEDLDVDRCRREYAEQMIDDLLWLGLNWDEGGLVPGFCQSERTEYYAAAFAELSGRGMVYPCFCTRAERLAASAPHREDGAVIYSGRCRNLAEAERQEMLNSGRRPAWRIAVPDECSDDEWTVIDGNLGRYSLNPAKEQGDYIVRRSDGVYAYQLAVVVDDALMGVNHVVRGRDLLSSAPCQAWLARELGYAEPEFFHVPLLLAEDGKRLSKREKSLDMGALRERYTAEELIGRLAYWAGLQNEARPVSPAELVAGFCWERVAKEDIVAVGL